jgi:hypothetical protein
MVVFTINVSHGTPTHNAFGQVVVFATREAAEASLAEPEFAQKLAESVWKTAEVVEVRISE